MRKNNFKIMALILARRGSTGVPGKNIKPKMDGLLNTLFNLHGEPICASPKIVSTHF